jgi:hypothetical protein
MKSLQIRTFKAIRIKGITNEAAKQYKNTKLKNKIGIKSTQSSISPSEYYSDDIKSNSDIEIN